MATLVDDLGNLFQSHTLSQVAENLDESEGSITRGFQTSAAAILGGLAGKSNEPGIMTRAFDMITGTFSDGGILNNLSGFFRSGPNEPARMAGSKFLSMLFGTQQSGLTDKISQTSGLRLDSAAKLLGLAAPFVMSWLGKRITQDNLTSKEFTQLVQREGATATSLLPAGISSYLTTPVAATSRVVSSVPPPPAPTTSRWLWPLMALAALLLLWGWAAMRRPAGETIGQVAERVGEPAKVVVTRVNTTLADGTNLSIPTVGLESELLNYLRNPPATVDPNRWFEFDRLYFDTSQATLRSDSQEQLRNIAAILKAHPNARVKIGAYTDNTGDSAANMTLSQQRADSVRSQLMGMGIAAERIESEGYGEQHPVADNSTEAGRARNRRVAMRITAL